MSRLEELLLLILDRAQKSGLKGLSSFQMFKIPYLLQVFSLKYAGTPFIPETIFMRHENGPISADIYAAIENLQKAGFIRKEAVKKPDYEYARHNHSLGRKLPKLKFDKGEILFLDNFVNKFLRLTHKQLKKVAYSTEPMKAITRTERFGRIRKGAVIDLSTITVDPDTVDTYSDSDATAEAK